MKERRHYDRELYAIDERIGRLALLCSANLSDPQVVTALIKGQFDVCKGTDARAVRMQQELRGMLILKYQIESACIDSIGATDCARLMTEQDAQLRRNGFPAQSLTKIG